MSTVAAPAETAAVPDLATPAKKRRGAAGENRSTPLGLGIRYALLILSLAIVLMPVYVLLVTSFKDASQVSPVRTWYLPTSLDFTNWKNAFDTLAPALGRSLSLVIPSSIISAMLGSANGFVLSRWRFPGANVVFTFILFDVGN